MSNIKFKIAAKTNVGRVRTNNEDNFQAACDLTTAPMKWVNDMECDLGSKGALLVVADGMGGMNAGEVASEIAINTIRDFFSPERITDDVISSNVNIRSFMKNSIIEADKNIKKTAKEHPEHKGMGTTIVIAWILKDYLFLAWCGDSRAYIYNRKIGLKQISKDHSFVQELVDKGKISREDAFDYPDSNIITRCLGDSSQKARPDTLHEPIQIHNNDIILLCTDGLSGMIRDHEIEMVLSENEDNMSECSDQLIEAACEAAGDDNITVALCKILSGATEQVKQKRKNRLTNTISFASKRKIVVNRGLITRLLLSILGVILLYCIGFQNGKRSQISDVVNNTVVTDTINYKDSINILLYINDSLQNRVDSVDKEKDKLVTKLNELDKTIKDFENDTAVLNTKEVLKRLKFKMK